MLRSGCEREGAPNAPIGRPSLQVCPGFTVVARFRRVPVTSIDRPLLSLYKGTNRLQKALDSKNASKIIHRSADTN